MKYRIQTRLHSSICWPEAPEAVLTVVGDDAQAIYSSAQRLYATILDFPNSSSPPANMVTAGTRNYPLEHKTSLPRPTA